MSCSFAVEELVVEVRTNKRRKRNVGFLFQPDGSLVLDAPPRTGQAELESMVREHLRWIRHRLRQARSQAAENPPLKIEDGALVPYLGEMLNVRWQAGRPRSVQRQGRELRVITPDSAQVRDEVRAWYKSEGEAVFPEQLDRWRSLPWIGGRSVSWRQRYMKSQWGSCSAGGSVSLNTHLLKLPDTLIEYVVLHELCHLKHMDHSRRFHALMDRHMPDWDARRRALRRHLGALLGD